ncbi:ABC transporter ATP-binding protein [Paenibacillus sp. FA6]|uniref:ABC transporter ATP-binding protein n=1 Tax=Paenibacillus sp. FA6 TaxID=3413029 RepID=UPI003F658DC3
MTSILEMDQLSKRYGDQPILNAFTSQICNPETITLLGGSGQGKSTLLRILCRMEAQDDGEVRLHGRSCLEVGPIEWRKKISYVSQQSYMLPGSVEDNLRTVSKLHKIDFDYNLAKQLMSSLNLDDLDWGKKSSELSGGEKQRVALVRSLMLRSEILLLDEVTASLDMQSKLAVEKLLQDWREQEGVACIWITHDLQQAQRLNQRVWYIAGGSLLEDSDCRDFFDNPITDSARSYLQLVPQEES